LLNKKQIWPVSHGTGHAGYIIMKACKCEAGKIKVSRMKTWTVSLLWWC